MLMTWTAALVLAQSASGFPTVEPDFQAILRGEAAALATTEGRITRKGRSLNIQTATGVRVFRNSTAEGEGAQGYLYAGSLLEGRYALLLVTGWEWWAYELVHLATGHSLPLGGVPLLSPDRSHAVVISLDLDAQYRKNTLELIRFTEGGARRAFRWDFGPESGPSDPVWKDDTTVTFRWHRVVTRDPLIQTSRRPGRLSLRDGKWVLQ